MKQKHLDALAKEIQKAIEASEFPASEKSLTRINELANLAIGANDEIRERRAKYLASKEIRRIQQAARGTK